MNIKPYILFIFIVIALPSISIAEQTLDHQTQLAQSEQYAESQGVVAERMAANQKLLKKEMAARQKLLEKEMAARQKLLEEQMAARVKAWFEKWILKIGDLVFQAPTTKQADAPNDAMKSLETQAFR